MPRETSRRGVLLAGAVAGIAGAGMNFAKAEIPKRPDTSPDALAHDESYWARVAELYDVRRDFLNLEHGYWGVMSKPVLADYLAHTERVNRAGSYYARREFGGETDAVYARLASFLGVGADELVLTRGASEALQAAIGGYNRLKPGDGVLYADIDYDAMKSAMTWLEARRGARIVKIAMPEPATRANVVEAYRAAFDANPDLKLVLLTHVSHLNGLVLPVAEIAAMAKARGIDVILDSAHALGQLDFSLPALGPDFVGMNLQKWIGAPIGCGLLYARKTRVRDIDRFMGEPGDEDDIRARVHTGTLNFAAHLAIPAALDFHDAIGGAAAKEARLRSLRNLWVAEARAIGGVGILTTDDPLTTCALAAFRFRGKTGAEENIALARRLADEHGVFTVRRTGLAGGDCIRVTPAAFTSAEQVLRLPAALRALAG